MVSLFCFSSCFFFQAEDGIRDLVRSRGLGDVYKRQLLLVDGDPIANIKLIEDPAKNFVLIMKDGKIYRLSLIHI